MLKTVRDVQEELGRLGIFTGAVDGILGPVTRAAIKKFQAKTEDLDQDGILGPQTLAKLFPAEARLPTFSTAKRVSEPLTVIPWMDMIGELMRANEGARRGIDERDDRAVIGEWASDLGVRNFDATTTPWCGLTVAHMIRETCPDEHLPSNILGARQFEKFGTAVVDQWGAVLVFWRESKASGKGHVGFYAGERPDAYLVRGGNQGDKISDAWVSKARLLSARWPSTAKALATDRRVLLSADGRPLSANEA